MIITIDIIFDLFAFQLNRNIIPRKSANGHYLQTLIKFKRISCHFLTLKNFLLHSISMKMKNLGNSANGHDR